MADSSVQDLFRRAVADDDAAAMREGLEQLLGITGNRGLSAAEEYALRAPDFVMEMPQSDERIRGRDDMRSMQEAFPAPPISVQVRRVTGGGHTWVLEGNLDYGQGPWVIAMIIELTEDGLIARETRYYAEKSEAPAWRAQWSEPLA
jgi:hypothetical protein